MQGFGGGSLENDLQSWQELCEREGCALRTTIACRALGGGSLENDLQSWQELCEREGCALRNTIVCRALGGGSLENDLQSWQELCEREGMHWWLLLHVGLWGGRLENDLQWWQELYAREGFALRNTIACRALGGEVYKKTCNREKNSMQGKDVHWGIPLYAELWGGKFRKWLAMVTRTLWKGRMCIEEYHCMQSFGGGKFIKMTCNRDKNSMQGKDVHWGLPLHAELWGGKFRKWLAMVTRTLWKGRMCIEDYPCMQSFGGGEV